MPSVKMQANTILHSLAGMLLFVNIAAAQMETKAKPRLARDQADIELPVSAHMDAGSSSAGTDAACHVSFPSTARNQANMFSPDQEVDLGDAIAESALLDLR